VAIKPTKTLRWRGGGLQLVGGDRCSTCGRRRGERDYGGSAALNIAVEKPTYRD